MSLNLVPTPIDAFKDMQQSCRKSLYALSKGVLDFEDVNKKTHGKIIELLENDSRRKLICVPRGCLKSSLACVAYPIWLLLNNPDLRILIDSELYTNSSTFLREIKTHVESNVFVNLFGKWKSNVWNESEIIIKPRQKTLKEASITCGGIGTTKVGQHFDVIIADDMNSPQNTSTIEQARKVIDHYKYSTSILEPTGTYLVIGTRYSQNDLIGHIIENEQTNLSPEKLEWAKGS
jgi:hypothetical protein